MYKQLVKQLNPYILLQTWEWTFLKIHNLLNKKKTSSEDAEAEAGCMIREQDFQAEKFKYVVRKN